MEKDVQVLMDIVQRNAQRPDMWHKLSAVQAATVRVRLANVEPQAFLYRDRQEIHTRLSFIFEQSWRMMQNDPAEPNGLVCARAAESLLELSIAPYGLWDDETRETIFERLDDICEKAGPVSAARLCEMVLRLPEAVVPPAATAIVKEHLLRIKQQGGAVDPADRPQPALAFAKAAMALHARPEDLLIGRQGSEARVATAANRVYEPVTEPVIQRLWDVFEKSASRAAVVEGSPHHALCAVGAAEALSTLTDLQKDRRAALQTQLITLTDVFAAKDRVIDPMTGANRAINGVTAVRTVLGMVKAGLPLEGAVTENTLRIVRDRNLEVDEKGAVVGMHGYAAATAIEAQHAMRP